MRHRRHEAGASVVEFALVFPVVIAVMFGIIQYGYHFWALETGAASAREAARRLAVGADWACTRTEAIERLGQPAVGSTPPAVARAYSTGGTTPVVGSTVTVTVSFQSLDLGFLPLPGSGVIVESGHARVENLARVPTQLCP